MSKVIVIGGGAAGAVAAIFAARNGHRVELFEKNEKIGKSREQEKFPLSAFWAYSFNTQQRRRR